MVEISKEKLIHYFPYRIESKQVLKNETALNVLSHIASMLWNYLNNPQNTSDLSADLELKLVDLRAEVAQWQKKLQDMQAEASDELKERFREREEQFKKVAREHLDEETRKIYPRGNCSYELADDPEQFQEDYEKVEEEFSDVTEQEEKILDDFNKKMKSISTVKFRNIDPFMKEDMKKVPGDIKTIVRLLIQEDNNDGQ